MVRFEEANTRLFKGVFICRNCKSKTRAPNIKVVQGKVTCRKCSSKALRPKKRK